MSFLNYFLMYGFFIVQDKYMLQLYTGAGTGHSNNIGVHTAIDLTSLLLGSIVHHEEIFLETTFTQMFKGPLDDLSVGSYVVFQHIHGIESIRVDLTYS